MYFNYEHAAFALNTIKVMIKYVYYLMAILAKFNNLT